MKKFTSLVLGIVYATIAYSQLKDKHFLRIDDPSCFSFISNMAADLDDEIRIFEEVAILSQSAQLGGGQPNNPYSNILAIDVINSGNAGIIESYELHQDSFSFYTYGSQNLIFHDNKIYAFGTKSRHGDSKLSPFIITVDRNTSDFQFHEITSDSSSQITAMCLLNDELIFVLNLKDSAAGFSKNLLLKSNSTFEFDTIFQFPRTSITRFYQLKILSDGSIFIAGNGCNSNTQCFYGQREVKMFNISPNGQLNWMKKINGENDDFDCYTLLQEDGIFLAGIMYYNDPFLIEISRPFLAKINYDGEIVWLNRFTEFDNSLRYPSGLTTTINSDLLLISNGSYTNSSILIIDRKTGVLKNKYLNVIDESDSVQIENFTGVVKLRSGRLLVSGDQSSFPRRFTYITELNDYIGIDAYPFGISNSQVKSEVKIYPNPVDRFFNIESSESVDSIIVRDLLGKLVLKANPNLRRVDISSLKDGIYLLEIQCNNQTQIVRIIKT